MKAISWCGLLTCWCVATAACSNTTRGTGSWTPDAGSAATGGDAGGGSGGTGGDAGSGGSGPSGGTAGQGGASGSGATGGAGGGSPFTTNPPGIEREQQPQSNGANIDLLTTSLTQRSTSSLNYFEWFGEVANVGSEVRCYIQLHADFQSSTGTSIIKLDTFVYASPFKMGSSSLTAPCLAPGTTGIVWSNDLPTTPVPIDSIKRVVVSIEALVDPSAVPHPAAPRLSPLTKTLSGQRWAISGTATSIADVYNVSIDFFGKTGKFFVDRETVYHLENFLTAQTWAFDTSPLGLETTTLDEVVPILDFIEGTDTTAFEPALERDTSQAAVLYRAWSASTLAARERAERAR